MYLYDRQTLSSSYVRDLGGVRLSGATYHDSNDVIYGVEGAKDTLVTLDPETGEVTTVGEMGYNGVYGLAYNPMDNMLYAVDHFADVLLRINPYSGQATEIAQTSLSVASLTFDDNGILYATHIVPGVSETFYTIDLDTGVASTVLEYSPIHIQALVFVPAPGMLASLPVTLLLVSVRRRRV